MKRNIIAISLGAILFAGTLGAAVADPTSTSSTTTVTTQKATSTKPGTDGWITAKVNSDLAMAIGNSSRAVTVSTMDGVVTLSGTLDSKADVAKAVATAQGVMGVHSVDSSALIARSVASE